MIDVRFCRDGRLCMSYRSGLYGFYVGNSTSAAYVKCATFRKHDGKILGWDAFADTNVVFGLVRELARIQFKEGADYAGRGIVPVPDAPFFTKDGFWVFWGDYMIIHGTRVRTERCDPLAIRPMARFHLRRATPR